MYIPACNGILLVVHTAQWVANFLKSPQNFAATDLVRSQGWSNSMVKPWETTIEGGGSSHTCSTLPQQNPLHSVYTSAAKSLQPLCSVFSALQGYTCTRGWYVAEASSQRLLLMCKRYLVGVQKICEALEETAALQIVPLNTDTVSALLGVWFGNETTQ